MRYNIFLIIASLFIFSCETTPGLDKTNKDKNKQEKPKGQEDGGGAQDLDAASKNPWEIYKKLAPQSNEAVLIKRAADYIVRSKKEPDYLAEVSTAAGLKNIESSVEKVLKSNNFQAIYSMFKKMLPVHRCSKDTLEGINRLNYFLSAEILFNKKNTSDEIKPLVDLLTKTYKRADLENIVKHRIIEDMLKKVSADPSISLEVNFDEPAACQNINSNDPAVFQNCLDSLKFTKDADSALLIEGLDNIIGIKAEGIDYLKDKAMGTNKYVFNILGINRYSKYGNVVIPLDADIIKSSWNTPVAATYFNNAPTAAAPVRQVAHYGARAGRVWVEAKNWTGADGGQALVDFKNSKIRGDRETKALVAAIELLARTAAYHRGDNSQLDSKARLEAALGPAHNNKSFEQIAADEIRKYMEAVDAHELIEMHIPPFMAKNIYKVVLSDAVYKTLDLPMKNIPLDKFEQVPHNSKDPAENQRLLNKKTESYSAPQ